MKTLNKLFLIAVVTTFFLNSAVAQTADDYHPFLSDKFNIELGVFWPQIDFTAQVDVPGPG